MSALFGSNAGKRQIRVNAYWVASAAASVSAEESGAMSKERAAMP